MSSWGAALANDGRNADMNGEHFGRVKEIVLGRW
jgi:hypothetical protein